MARDFNQSLKYSVRIDDNTTTGPASKFNIIRIDDIFTNFIASRSDDTFNIMSVYGCNDDDNYRDTTFDDITLL